MPVEWTDAHRQWFVDKIGKPYSVMDALRAYLGIALSNDDKWQCAELVQDFYKNCGIDLAGKPTPTRMIRQSLALDSSYLVSIN